MTGLGKPLLGFSLFALAAVLVTTVIWNTLARNVSGPVNTYTALFTDVQGLRKGDDVRMAGVRVGKVATIDIERQADTKRYAAKVTFVVERDQTLYDDTKALVRYQNLIGQRFIALAPGTAAASTPLHPGARIPLTRTEPSFDISGLLNGFQPLFQILDPQQVNDLSATLIQALQGDRVSLSAFITQAATLAGDFQRRDTILADVITNLSTVMQGLAARGDELETLVTQTRALIGGLYDQGQALQDSTTQIASGTAALATMLERIQPKLTLAQSSTSAALNLLLANGDRLDKGLPDFTALLLGVGKASQTGAYANGYICSLDVSLYGVLFPRGVFSQIGGNSHSAVCRP
ncbi:MCE family protein [Nocardia uniformis]|uniref:MCE family protein n=1 Tax=Nocardia uniformis TaxID=53432 RepID=A0A849C4B5_9NOCA|nr:MlaD family protein [Nocardia uniformis]NNH71185.1 MCE family protein [Nocardia uniformis]